MSEQDKQAATEHARRASSQAKNAIKNSGRAAKHAAVAGADATTDVAEDFYDAAKDRTVEGVDAAKDVAGDVADASLRTGRKVGAEARRLDARILDIITSDMSQGIIALGVAIWAGSVSVSKFSSAFDHGRAMR